MKRNKYYVAITGGIGSGKSEVLKMIRGMGYPAYSADEVAHGIYEDPAVLEQTEKEFPDCVAGHKIDRKKLADRVFADASAREKLESITHPAIMKRLFCEMDGADSRYVFAEVPLLFEGGFEKDFDAVIVVMRDLRERIRSAAERDKVSEQKIISRVKNQFDYEKNTVSGHTVIYNDGDLKALSEKVKKVVHEIVGECEN